MAHISLENVDVDFLIYDLHGRSLKQELMRIGTGGKLATDARDRVTVKALTNINIEFNEGDRIGLLGHNGAGKSTLLKVIAGIYEPIRGIVKTSGVVAPLFDAMIGMDTDSTGIENIRLRGLYLDLKAEEIEQRIADITEFSELGNYLHAPIRTYSTGMIVRLAFAILTSTRPDIVLMDEVIGAGDATFIKKAEKRLEGFLSEIGILVVASHAPDMLRKLCNRGLVFHHGVLHFDGTMDEAIASYNALTNSG